MARRLSSPSGMRASSQTKPASLTLTPRSKISPSWRCTSAKGTTSSTSLAITKPRIFSGRRSIHSKRSRSPGQRSAMRRALALAQVRAHLEQQVLARQHPDGLELPEEVRGEGSRARPQLEHVAARGLEHLRALAREALGVHVGEISGAVTKSPSPPNLREPAV